ncbi:MAG: hypothetical protein M1812_004624 [Candelaria pacifica]|nr:MAG: hypothetical protein M1812_004624 [Candelaria pacifica]
MSNPSAGTKVSTDPASKQPTNSESTGAIASDSLAAESINSGGAFSSNKTAQPLSVSGSNSTLNNTDTSGATTLPPAPDAETRLAQNDWNESSKLKSAEHLSQDQTSSKSNLGNMSYSTSGSGADTYTSNTSNDSSGVGSNTQGSTAPSALNPSTNQAAKESKPKGKNITEGGFDDDPSKNASFTSDIGDKNDPGRAAENKMQREVAESGPDAGGSGPRQKGLTKDGQFDVLGDEAA